MTTARPLEDNQLLSRFQALDAFLREHQSLWRPRPFTQLHLPWETEHSALSSWLRQRSLNEAEAAHNHPEQLHAPRLFHSWPAWPLSCQRSGSYPQSLYPRQVIV